MDYIRISVTKECFLSGKFLFKILGQNFDGHFFNIFLFEMLIRVAGLAGLIPE